VAYAIKRLESADKERHRVLYELSLHEVSLTFEERKKKGLWNKRLKKL